MKVQVATVSSRCPEWPYYRFDAFLESLHRFAEAPTVLGTNTPFCGLMSKAFLYRDWLRAGKNASDRLILCDAWDILFLAHPHGVADRCQELFGDALVYNGERGLWPCGELTEDFPDTGPWRYLNSGFICGPADKLLAMFESMDLESIGVDRPNPDGSGHIQPNDQGEIQKIFKQQAVPMVVDGRCQIAMTMHGLSEEEFTFKDGVLTNCVTGSTPGVAHFNGSGMNSHFDRFAQWLGLPVYPRRTDSPSEFDMTKINKDLHIHQAKLKMARALRTAEEQGRAVEWPRWLET